MNNQFLLPNNWQILEIRNLIEKIPLTGIKLKMRDYNEDGKYPVIDQGQELIGGFTDEEMLVPCELPVIVFGDHTKEIKFIDFPFVAGADGIKVIKPKSVFNSKLFYYFLQAVKIPDKGYARHYQYLEKELIPIPPIEEQVLIVSKIEELFSQLDAGVAGLKRAQAALKRYRASVLKNAVEGNLLNNEKKIANCIQIGWKETTINNISKKDKNSIKRGPFGSSVKKAYFVPEGYKIYQQKNVIKNDFSLGDYYIDAKRFANLIDFQVFPGDVLITGAGTIGKVAIVPKNIEPGIMNQALLKISLNPEIIITDYFLYFFEVKAMEYLLAKTRGSAMQNISSVRDLKEMKILLPSINEQRQIVNEVERQLTIINEIRESIINNLNRTSNIRHAILKHAYQGKLI